MSMRPHHYIVCGIDNLITGEDRYTITDPRFPALDRDWRVQKCPEPNAAELAWLENPQFEDLASWQWDIQMAWYHLHDLREKELYDILYFNPEYGPANVLGLKVEGGSNDILYLLRRKYPEYQRDGYQVMPNYPDEENFSEGARIVNIYRENWKDGYRRIPRLDRFRRRAIDYHWLYKHGWAVGDVVMVPNVFLFAFYLICQKLGWQIDMNDFKFMEVWDWC